MENIEAIRKKNSVLSSIIELLRKKDMSIAELSRELDMKRSTLVYYLNLPELQKYIKKERIEKKETGRPTMIKLNKNVLKEENLMWKVMASKVEKEYLDKPITKKILEFLSSKREVNRKEIFALSSKSIVTKIIALDILENRGYINNLYKITTKGREFLKKHKKDK